VAVGVEVSGLTIGAGVVLAAVLGIALVAALWWGLPRPRHALRRAQALRGEGRGASEVGARLLQLPAPADGGRDNLRALNAKQTLAHVRDPLGTIPAVALCGFVALYLLGHNAFRLRGEGSVSVPRLVVTTLCYALIPVAVSVRSLPTLAVVAVLLCGLAAFETATSREFRCEIRAR
jgi:hypothetical protein